MKNTYNIDLNLLITHLQQAYRKRRAYQLYRQETGIDIDDQSQKNILALYKELREGNELPEETRKRINKEKKSPGDALTKDEFEFFTAQLNVAWWANHASFQSEAIQKSQYLLSANELKRRKIDVDIHTGAKEELDCVFFSYGYPDTTSTVNFLAGADVFFLNLDYLQKHHNAVYNSAWTGGHTYAYFQHQMPDPVLYSTPNGVAKIKINYNVSIYPTFKLTKTYTFTNTNETHTKIINKEDEIVSGKHIKTWHILKMIEFLRHLEPEMRSYILKNKNNLRLIGELFQLLFRAGTAEFHVPAAVKLDTKNPNFTIFKTVSDDKDIKYQFYKAVTAGNRAEVLNLFKKNGELNQFKFYSVFSDRVEAKDATLLNIAVWKQDVEMVATLIACGMQPGHEYKNIKQHKYVYYAERSALQDAIEIKNKELIKLLCEPPARKLGDLRPIYAAPVTYMAILTAIANNTDVNTLAYLLKHYNNHHLDKLLVAAAYYENIPAMQLLLNAGADPNKTIEGRQTDTNMHIIPLSLEGTALTIAAEYGRVNAVEFLIKNGADVNAYAKNNLRKFGRGNSPLIAAVKGLLDKKSGYTSKSYYGSENIKTYYQDLPASTEQNYLTVIELLINAHANQQYKTGSTNENFIYHFRKYYDKCEKSPELESLKAKVDTIVETNINDDYDGAHDSYAMVVGKDENKDSYLLIGTDKHDHLIVPGGRLDYLVDENSYTAAINYAGLQTGIDLVNQKMSKMEKYGGKNDYDCLQFYYFNLSGSIQNYPLKNKTIYHDLKATKRSYHPLEKLQDLTFVKLSDIKIETVYYKGILFPLCTWQNKLFPLYLSVEIAKLCGRREFDNQNTKSLVQTFKFDSYSILHDAVKNGDINGVRDLLNVKLTEFENTKYCIIEALENQQYKMVDFLIDKDLLAEDSNIDWIFNYKVKKDLPETTLIKLYQAHKKILTTDTMLKISEFAVKHNMNDFIAAFINDFATNDEVMEALGREAMRHFSLTTVEKIFNHEAVKDKQKLARVLLNSHQQNSDGLSSRTDTDFVNYLCNLELLLDHVEQFTIKKPFFKKRNILLASLLHQYEHMVFNPINIHLMLRLQKLLSRVIDLGINACDENEYYILYRFNKYNDMEKYVKEKTELEAIMLKEPLFKIMHANAQRQAKKLDQLLWQYHDYPLLREALTKYKSVIANNDEQGNSPFIRAVKNGVYPVVKLLLETAMDKSDFGIHKLDANSYSAVDIAIQHDHEDVALLLMAYGVEVSENTLQLAKQHRALKVEKALLSKLNSTKNKNPMHIIISTEPTDSNDNKDKTGDVDYAKRLAESITVDTVKVTYLNNQTQSHFDKIIKNSKVPVIFHLLLNAPKTGFGVSKEYLQGLKAKKIKIVMTAVEFAKYQAPQLKNQMLDYLQHADEIIFLDENDKQQAIQSAANQAVLQQRLQHANVINVPPTIKPKNITQDKIASNIISFGILRRGKGLAHVTHLAELLKNSKHEFMQNKFIYIVGTVNKHKTVKNGTEYDGTLYKLLKQMYPQFAQRFLDKSPQQLVDIYNEIKETPPALPIKLFFDVNETDLANLFKECEYAYNPAYRGATLRNSSISTSLAFGNIVYSHVGSITPGILRKGGIFDHAMVLNEDDNYHTYAQHVFDDILMREKNKKHKNYQEPTRNEVTRKIAHTLLENELSLSTVAQQHNQLYQSLLPAQSNQSVYGSGLTTFPPKTNDVEIVRKNTLSLTNS